MFIFNLMFWGKKSPQDVVAKMPHCDFIVSEFQLQSFYDAYFRTSALGKGTNPLISPTFG